MEEEARRRRQRLQALREGKPIEEVHPEPADIVESLASYKPDQEPAADEPALLEYGGHPSGDSHDGCGPCRQTIFAGSRTLETQAKALLADLKDWQDPAQRVATDGPVTLESLAPKRPNWDLKEDWERRYAPLQKEYDRACVTLTRKGCYWLCV